MRRLAYIVALALLAALAFAPSASAFTMGKSTNGVFINRESTDTTLAASVYVYYGYKGGSTWSSSYNAGSSGSYDNSVFYGTMFGNGASSEGCEIPLVDGYRCQLVVLSISGYGQRVFAVLNEPLHVSLPSTQTVVVSALPPVVVSAMPTTTLDASATVSLDGETRDAVLGIGVGVAMLCAIGGVLAVTEGGR